MKMGSKITWFVILLVGVSLASPEEEEKKKEEKEASAIPTSPAAKTDENSHCPNATCTPAPVGPKCEPKYERDDKCCPVWHCDNGETVYGIQRSFSSGPGGVGSGSSTSWSSNWSSSSGEDSDVKPPSTWMGFGPLSRRFFNHSSFFDDF